MTGRGRGVPTGGGADPDGTDGATGRPSDAGTADRSRPARPAADGGSGFDRVRPRSVEPWGPGTIGDQPRDVDGTRLLFSQAEARPATGHAAVRCSRCGERTVVSIPALVRLALPSVHLPVPGRQYRSFMRCPACRARTWVAVELSL